MIQLSATYHHDLHLSKKDTQKFIQNLQELGLTIVGKPEISYENGLHSNAPAFQAPKSVEIKIKYDDIKLRSYESTQHNLL
jgi:hypothetical protein